MQYNEIFHQKFSPVYRQIASIQDQMLLTKGKWIFTLHVHSKADLMRSEHFEKIHSICEKIGEDVIEWCKNDAFSEDARRAYASNRDKVARKLRDLRSSIHQRRETKLESLLDFFDGFSAIILRVLPTFVAITKLALAGLGGGLPLSLPSSRKA